MSSRKIIVLTLDGWSASFLGPYGNTWVTTSTLNSLARDALLVEYAIADGVDLETGLASLWQGRHALCSPCSDAASLGDLLSDHRRTTQLITDDAVAAHTPLAARMSTVTLVDVPATDQPAFDSMHTQFGQFLANVTESMNQNADCVWIHAKGFLGSWDAPFELRLALSDEDEDPDPSRSVEPPHEEALSDDDPDAAWSLARAYAAQVMSVDQCLGFLFGILGSHTVLRDALWIVTSPRGYPLGEHGRVGWKSSTSPPLHSELLHVPLLVRWPEQESLLLRSQSIVQPSCVLPTMLDWLEISHATSTWGGVSLRRLLDNSVEPQGFDRAVARSDTELAIRTPGWFLRLADSHGDPQSGKPMLYVKPDDRWEANEVADRCPAVVGVLRKTLGEFASAATAETLNELGELPESLFTSTI